MQLKLLFLFLILATTASSQSDTVSILKCFRDTTGNKAPVFIQQDPLIRLLLEQDLRINEKQQGIKNGYRIQIFSSYGNDARERSRKVRGEFLTLFPDFDPTHVYSIYEPPYIKVRIGDYRTRVEALEDYRNIVKEYPDSYFVKTHINYPELQSR